MTIASDLKVKTVAFRRKHSSGQEQWGITTLATKLLPILQEAAETGVDSFDVTEMTLAVPVTAEQWSSLYISALNSGFEVRDLQPMNGTPGLRLSW